MIYLSDIIELIKVSIWKPSASDIDKSRFGLNAFFNQPSLGPIDYQAEDIESMGLKYVRLLFHWNNDTQSSEDSPINFSFYDDIVDALPKHFRAVVVIGGCPSWASLKRDPNKAFINYAKAVAERYKDRDVIWGYQIGNETNQNTGENYAYGFDEPSIYVDTLKTAYIELKKIKPSLVITNAATTSIIQGWRHTIEYNEDLIAAGVLDWVDQFSFHYYGDSFLNFYRPGGAYRLLKKVSKPMLITEIGTNKTHKHLSCILEKLPYLCKKLPSITIAFWYQYDGGGTTEDFGLLPHKTSLYKYLKS